MGKSVVRRDKLFSPKYTIYLKIKDKKLYNEILENLRLPKNTPSLGMDDELIEIKNIKTLEMEEHDTNKINSIFLDKNISYKAYVKDLSKSIELPTINLASTKFIAFDKKIKEYQKSQIKILNLVKLSI